MENCSQIQIKSIEKDIDMYYNFNTKIKNIIN